MNETLIEAPALELVRGGVWLVLGAIVLLFIVGARPRF